MNLRFAVLAVFAAGHLVLAACGAASVTMPSAQSAVGRALRWYGAMTGADAGFGFFAPGVGSETRAVFTLKDADGRTWSDTLDCNNQEVRLRLVGMLASSLEDEMRPDLVASWSALMFGRHPTATQVTVRIDVFDVPTLGEARAGDTAEWETLYEITTQRKSPTTPSEKR